MNILAHSKVIIYFFVVFPFQVSIVLCMCCCIVSAWKLICPDRSHRKNRAQGFCNDSSWKNYTCLFDKNYKTFNESCSLKPDIVPPGKIILVKIGCSFNKLVPLELKEISKVSQRAS